MAYSYYIYESYIAFFLWHAGSYPLQATPVEFNILPAPKPDDANNSMDCVLLKWLISHSDLNDIPVDG